MVLNPASAQSGTVDFANWLDQWPFGGCPCPQSYTEPNALSLPLSVQSDRAVLESYLNWLEGYDDVDLQVVDPDGLSFFKETRGGHGSERIIINAPKAGDWTLKYRVFDISSLDEGGSGAVGGQWGIFAYDFTSDGLVGEWKLNDGSGNTASDTSGNGNTGTLNNGPVWESGSSCKVGNCLRFDGINDYVDMGLGNNLDLTGNEYTIAFWMKWDGSTGTLQRMVNKDDGNNFSGGYSILIDTLGPAGSFSWTHNNGFNNNWDDFMTATANQWHHYAFVYDNPTRYAYKDGTLITTNNPNGGNLHSDGDDPFRLGSMHIHGQYLDGNLDQVRVYDRALTQQEITDLVNET